MTLSAIYHSSPRCHGTDNSHINVAATGNNNKRGTLSRLPEPTYSLVTFQRRRNETFSSLPLLRGPFPRQVSALTDSGGETQYARCRPLPRLCGKKRLKKNKKIEKSERAATLPAKQLDFDRLRVSAEVSSNFILSLLLFCLRNPLCTTRLGSVPAAAARLHSRCCTKYCKLS